MKPWVKTGLIWGATVFILLAFVFPFFKNEEITQQHILMHFFSWLIGGLIFGYVTKKKA